MIKKNRYERLTQERIKKGYSVAEMAEKVGISKSFYCQIETKSKRLNYPLALKIARVFDLKPDDLFFEE